MLTVKSAAERAGVSGAMVYGWCASGRLAHLRLGGRGRGVIRIEEADLDAFLASCRRGEHREEVKKAAPSAPRPKLRHLKL